MARSSDCVVNRRILDVADPEFQIGQAVLHRQRLAERDHFRGNVHGDHLFRALGQQLGEGAFAGAEVGDDFVIEHLDAAPRPSAFHDRPGT